MHAMQALARSGFSSYASYNTSVNALERPKSESDGIYSICKQEFSDAVELGRAPTARHLLGVGRAPRVGRVVVHRRGTRRADVVVADHSGGAEGDDDAVDKSDLLGTLGLLHVGADRVFGQLPPLEETPPLSGVSVGWLLFLLPGVFVVAWRCRSRQEPEDEAFSAYGTRRPAPRKFI